MVLIRTRRFAISRRGAFLALFGGVYIALGGSYLSVPAAAMPALHKQLHSALQVLPLAAYGWAWIVTGALAVIGGLVHRLDFVGFGAGVFMPGAWALIDLIAQVKDDVPRAWVGTLIYLLLALAISLVASMPDPLDDVKHMHKPLIGRQ